MNVQQISIEALHRRVRGEYLEMPGLRLTLSQAARLWDLDRATCQSLLHALTQVGFLVRTVDAAYIRSESWNGSTTLFLSNLQST